VSIKFRNLLKDAAAIENAAYAIGDVRPTAQAFSCNMKTPRALSSYLGSPVTSVRAAASCGGAPVDGVRAAASCSGAPVDGVRAAASCSPSMRAFHQAQRVAACDT